MFTGDRGHGIGSSIKGHQRFGGFQKQNKHGTFICLDSNCPKAFKPMCRDLVSTLAIGLAGLFGSTFLCFDETSTRTSKARFFDSALDFLQKKQRMGSPTDGGNTL
ncbi:hypothetical protein EDC94DRAFT_605976 [Helicostylum pulchrum]|nr:hypothetical protein EDC94DRAFT_605976 [Helicostylum pulchrum]